MVANAQSRPEVPSGGQLEEPSDFVPLDRLEEIREMMASRYGPAGSPARVRNRGSGLEEVRGILAQIRDAGTDQLATNILLSRRSHEDYHALLLMNRDDYDKTINLSIDLPAVEWQVRNGLSGNEIQPLSDDGFELFMPAGEPAVILIERMAQ